MTDEISTFQRVKNALNDLIAETPAGEKLPSEPALAEQFGASRATLREAMHTFEIRGLLRRQQGLGTFVIKPKHIIESGLEVLESIESQAKKIGLDVSMGHHNIFHVKATAKQAKKLNIEEGEPLLEIHRVILSERTPIAYLIDILPNNILSPGILSTKFTGSVLDLIIQMGKPSLSVAKTEISAVNADEKIAKALNITCSDTLLLLSGLIFDKEGTPVNISYSCFLPGYFRLHINRKIAGTDYFPES